MPEDFRHDVTWIAQRHGQDWRDGDILTALAWLEGLVSSTELSPRISAAEAKFQAAKAEWAQGRRVPLFDPSDTVAWYLHQARRYADPTLRSDFFLPEGYRIAPLFKRIGQLLPDLRGVHGGDDRAARLMTENLSQPDDGIFELLVAGAYRRRGWNAAFVPEMPGIAKRNDLQVSRPRSKWAVECKRAGRSGYAKEERLAGERMAEHVHDLSSRAARPIIVMARFKQELHSLDERYLAAKAERFLDDHRPYEWDDEVAEGMVADVLWNDLHDVMIHDDIYFGSTRMFELMIGAHDPMIDFTMAGEWEPAEGRPLHATWVDHVSLVAWRSTSDEAARRKAMHFRGLVSKAANQLPGDRPGVIHVGYEATGGNGADARRHYLNTREMRTFDPEATGLQIVYGNYFMNELVTARNESSAVTETLAWYPIGGRRTRGPIPAHMLFMDEDGAPGSHLR